MIIDCHCHAGTGDGLTGPWDTRAALPAYVARARRAGIDHVVLLAAFHSDYAVANREVAALVRRLRANGPLTADAFAFVHPERDRGRIHALVRVAVVQYGFVGIKVHRHDARITREVCEAARRFGVPVLYDVVGEIAPLTLLAGEYPDVAFIIPHLGSFADDWTAQSALIEPLARFPNLFADTSGVRRFDVLADAVARAGAHKILFGSDGPWLHPGVELEKVRALGLSTRDEALVTSGNYLRLTAHARRRLVTSRLRAHVAFAARDQ